MVLWFCKKTLHLQRLDTLMSTLRTIIFDSPELINWTKTIAEATNHKFEEGEVISLRFNNISDKDIAPAHIVSLACLIEYIHKMDCRVSVPAAHTNTVSDYILTKLRIKEYWQGGRNHVVALSENIFNLWRIVDSEKETFSILVHNYLKRTLFKSKDLSAVQNSLVETYYNIFDHAQANGNAFTFLKFDETTGELFVAACDFGVGIAASVKNHVGNIDSDKDAIVKAFEYNFTTKSKQYNKGMGLGNIKDTCTGNDTLTIISGTGLVVANVDTVEPYDNDFSFPGTLIYYKLTLPRFEEEEILDNFEL